MLYIEKKEHQITPGIYFYIISDGESDFRCYNNGHISLERFYSPYGSIEKDPNYVTLLRLSEVKGAKRIINGRTLARIREIKESSYD